MEIVLQKPRTAGDWLRLYLLYLEAFPPSERKPFAMIRRMYRQGKTDVWCILADGKFAGLAATISGGNLILLDYFAVRKSCRGQGIGLRTMRQLLEMYRQQGFFVEIESTLEDCLDREVRMKRKGFYLDCGLEEMGTEALVFGVRMELLGLGCWLDFESYRNFYRDYYSPWAAEHLEELQHL